MADKADDIAFESALSTIPNRTVALPGSSAVLRIERSDMEPAIIMELFDGTCIRSAVCTKSIFQLHKQKARLDVAWDTLFQLMKDVMSSAPPGITTESSSVDENIDVWFAYKVSDHVTMRASFELTSSHEPKQPMTRRLLEIMLAQIQESSSEKKILLERIDSLERQVQTAEQMERAEATAIHKKSPTKLRPHKRTRRARIPQIVPKGTKLKEGF